MINKFIVGGAVALALVGGAWGHGYMTARGQCQADKLRMELADTRVQLETLQRVVTEQAEIIEADTAKAQQVEAELADLKEMNADLVASITDGECLTEAESDALRRRLEGAR